MLAQRWAQHQDRSRRPDGDFPPAPRGQDRHGLSRLWPADRRGHLRRQCRPDAGREEVRPGQGLPPGHLRHVVDPRLDPGIHPALVVAGEMGTTAARRSCSSTCARLKGEISALRKATCAPNRWPNRHQARRHGRGSHLDEPPLSGGDASLNAPMRADGEASGRTGWPTTRPARPGTARRDRGVRRPHEPAGTRDGRSLNERERHIITERRLKEEPTTLEDLSAEYNVSRERVRQIEVRAFEKLQKAIREHGLEPAPARRRQLGMRAAPPCACPRPGRKTGPERITKGPKAKTGCMRD
jgi:hypothetical protein